jgi:hypothetical protein
MLDCDFSDETESFQGSHIETLPIQPSNGSWEWGALFGGAVGWLLGRTERPRLLVPPSACGEGGYTPEEKEFLSQIWRYEKELREVLGKKQWRRLYCLVLLAAESFKQNWSKFIPGNSGYSPSSKFDCEIRDTLPPFVDIILDAAALDYDFLLSKTEKEKVGVNNVYLDYETMEITIDDVPFSFLYPEPLTQIKS